MEVTLSSIKYLSQSRSTSSFEVRLNFAKPVCVYLFVNWSNLFLCLSDERNGSSPWGQGEQNSPSFSQTRVWLILESSVVDILQLC